jgi:hypothetical protein
MYLCMHVVTLQILLIRADHLECVDRFWFESIAFLCDMITNFREIVLRFGTGGRCGQD